MHCYLGGASVLICGGIRAHRARRNHQPECKNSATRGWRVPVRAGFCLTSHRFQSELTHQQDVDIRPSMRCRKASGLTLACVFTAHGAQSIKFGQRGVINAINFTVYRSVFPELRTDSGPDYTTGSYRYGNRQAIGRGHPVSCCLVSVVNCHRQIFALLKLRKLIEQIKCLIYARHCFQI